MSFCYCSNCLCGEFITQQYSQQICVCGHEKAFHLIEDMYKSCTPISDDSEIKYPIVDEITKKAFDEILTREEIESFKNVGGDINDSSSKPPWKDGTPFTAACFKGNINIMTMLLEAGADIDKPQKNKTWTGLMMACIFNRPYQVVEFLLLRGADVSVTKSHGKAANNYTSKCSPEVQALFLKAQSESPIIKKASTGKLTLDDIKFQDLDQISPLDKSTALIRASLYGHTTIVSLLIKNGANIYIKNKDDKNAFDVAKNEEIKQILNEGVFFMKACDGTLSIDDIQSHINPHLFINQTDHKDGSSMLIQACQHGNINTAVLLIQFGCDIYIKNKNGKTAYDLASNNEIKKLFIPLFLIDKASNGTLIESDITQYLTDGGNINYQSPIDGSTLIIKACQNGHSLIATLLNKYQANIHIPKSALELTNKEDIRKMLIEIDQQNFDQMQKTNQAIDQVLNQQSTNPDHRSTFRQIQYKEDNIQKSLLCSFCDNPLLPPLKMHKCGYMFCIDCRQEQKDCPKCHKHLDQNNVVDTISADTLESIDNLKMICPNCNNSIPRSNLYKHISSECLVYCPYGCGDQIYINDFKEHDNQCIAYPYECPASSVKCPWKDRKDRIEEHTKHCPYLQIFPILDDLQTVQNDLQNEIHQLKIQNLDYNMQFQDYNRQFLDIRQENIQLKNQIQQFIDHFV